MLTACVLAVVGLGVSFGHLGYPLNARHVLRGVASSALSREVAMAGAFVAAIGLTTLVALRSGRVSLVAVAGCFLIGLCAVWFMSEVYRRTSVVTWTHANTHVMFFGGVLVMGAALGFALVGPAAGRTLGFASLRTLFGWTAVLVLVGLAAQLAVLPSYVRAIDTNPMNAVVSYPLPSLEVFRSHAGARCMRWIISLAGAATLLCAVWQTIRSDEQVRFTLTFVAGVLLFGGEIIGRYLFYAIHGEERGGASLPRLDGAAEDTAARTGVTEGLRCGPDRASFSQSPRDVRP
jgi:anaerobic dimethyl sulfoxide reductase subunit C (anchor subunit)